MALTFTAAVELVEALHADARANPDDAAYLRGLRDQVEAVPQLVEVISDKSSAELMAERHVTERERTGKTYEEANWARLSPQFRAVHNALRRRRGESPIPEPIIDLYVPPPRPTQHRFDPNDREFVAASREFVTPLARIPGDEGFTINGQRVKF